jgi:hypothetical protein
MNFGAVRTDQERLQKSISSNQYLDAKPTNPEHFNWKLRPRTRQQEVGPEFRFNAHLQVERMMDHLKKSTGHQYTTADVKGSSRDNDKEMSKYLHTGEYSNMPGLKPEQFQDEQDYEVA